MKFKPFLTPSKIPQKKAKKGHFVEKVIKTGPKPDPQIPEKPPMFWGPKQALKSIGSFFGTQNAILLLFF